MTVSAQSLGPQLKKVLFWTRAHPDTSPGHGLSRAQAALQEHLLAACECRPAVWALLSQQDGVIPAGVAEPDRGGSGAPVGICNRSKRVACGAAAAVRDRWPGCDPSSARWRGGRGRRRLHQGRKGGKTQYTPWVKGYTVCSLTLHPKPCDIVGHTCIICLRGLWQGGQHRAGSPWRILALTRNCIGFNCSNLNAKHAGVCSHSAWESLAFCSALCCRGSLWHA